MGCDGIWETKSVFEMCEKVMEGLRAEQKAVDITQNLLDELIGADQASDIGCDNMTCILVHFKPPKQNSL